ncbi:26S proteasome regulatory subunit RPN3 [Bienertia sinuspersici]
MGLKRTFYCTLVYGANDADMREKRWSEITDFHKRVDDPWLLIGDFNCVLHVEERIGLPVSHNEILSFKNFVTWCDLVDMRRGTRVFTKIDRALIKEQWMSSFPDSVAHFLPEGDYDHSPCIIQFSIMFQVEGVAMHRVCSKIKALKCNLKQMNRKHCLEVEQT